KGYFTRGICRNLPKSSDTDWITQLVVQNTVNANEGLRQSHPAQSRCIVLRALFIALSESRSLRHIAERSRFGQRTSSRFVAGTQVSDAIRAAAAINQFGASVSVDNLGENVTSADEARASAQLYHHLLDEIAARRID